MCNIRVRIQLPHPGRVELMITCSDSKLKSVLFVFNYGTSVTTIKGYQEKLLGVSSN